MPRKVQFVTPENIEVSYEVAGIGSRFVAVLIDHAIQFAALLALYLVLGRALPGRLAGWIDAIVAIAAFLIIFGYFSLFEILWAGRTPGKRIAGLRVMRDTGYPVDPYSAIVRNLVRIVDFGLPPPYGAGLLSIFLSRDYKRLGDFAAGTIVVKERTPALLTQRTAAASPVAAILEPLVHDVDALTGEDFQLVHAFVLRKDEMDPGMRTHVAMRIAFPLLPRIGFHVAIPVPAHYTDLLEAIDRKYTQERGVLDGMGAALRSAAPR